MGIFGWSYPPGCSGPPDADEAPCEVCGHFVDECICPECPVCETYGDSNCYWNHGLTISLEQIKGLERLLDDEYAMRNDNRLWQPEEDVEW